MVTPSPQRLKGKWRKVLKGTPTKEQLMHFYKELEALSKQGRNLYS